MTPEDAIEQLRLNDGSVPVASVPFSCLLFFNTQNVHSTQVALYREVGYNTLKVRNNTGNV